MKSLQFDRILSYFVANTSTVSTKSLRKQGDLGAHYQYLYFLDYYTLKFLTSLGLGPVSPMDITALSLVSFRKNIEYYHTCMYIENFLRQSSKKLQKLEQNFIFKIL